MPIPDSCIDSLRSGAIQPHRHQKPRCEVEPHFRRFLQTILTGCKQPGQPVPAKASLNPDTIFPAPLCPRDSARPPCGSAFLKGGCGMCPAELTRGKGYRLMALVCRADSMGGLARRGAAVRARGHAGMARARGSAASPDMRTAQALATVGAAALIGLPVLMLASLLLHAPLAAPPAIALGYLATRARSGAARPPAGRAVDRGGACPG